MIQALLLLVAFQVAGDLLAGWLGLPVPGMVLGLAGLLLVLALRGRRLGREGAVPESLGAVAGGLHANLGLLFVPAGVGILAHLDLLVVEGPAILVVVLASTALCIGLGAAIAAPGKNRAP